MNSRKSLEVCEISIQRNAWGHIWVPPLIKGDDTVVVGINLGEELIKLCSGQFDPGSLERGFDFSLVQLTIVISIDALEQLPKLLLRLFDELSKF